MALNIRTPKAKSFSPGEVFDLDAMFAGMKMAGSDLERYMHKGLIVSVSPAAQVIKTADGAVVVTPTKPEEGPYIPKSVMGTVEKRAGAAATVVPPEDIPEVIGQDAEGDGFTPTSNLNLSADVLAKIEQVKKVISGEVAAPKSEIKKSKSAPKTAKKNSKK